MAFHEYLGDNSQRDYRRRITAGSRSDTNWSHATVTGGVGTYGAHDPLYISMYVDLYAAGRVYMRAYMCVCVVWCARARVLHT